MGIFNKFLRLFTLTIIFSLSGLLSLVVFTILIVKRKNVELSKKVMPIWLCLLFGLGVMIIQMKHPELVITTAMESLVCCLMYFTIENPNFKTPVIALTADAVAGAKEKYIVQALLII